MTDDFTKTADPTIRKTLMHDSETFTKNPICRKYALIFVQHIKKG